MKNHKNIAVFIPHLGCKHNCIFCSQTKITGASVMPDIKSELECVKRTIEEGLSTVTEGETEIAFFGGSFTGIDREYMISLLELASGYIGEKVKGIRCSTRPDYVNREICDILKNYGVTAVELGIQSTDDKVLIASRRGHAAGDSKRACELISENGFELGGQMMIGLPLSTAESEIQTARDIVAFGAKTSRIYPAVVFENTRLFDMAKSGEYIPLTTDDAVSRAAACAEIFIKNNVSILRIGLHSSENLTNAPYGANHPAIGELTEGEIYYNLIREQLEGIKADNITILIPPGELSKCIGHRGKNRKRFKELYNKNINFLQDGSLEKYSIKIISP